MNKLKYSLVAAGVAFSLTALADEHRGGSLDNSGNTAILGSALANEDSDATVTTSNSVTSDVSKDVTVTKDSSFSKDNTSTSDNNSASATDGSLAVTALDSGNGNLNAGSGNTLGSGNLDDSDNSVTSDVTSDNGAASAADGSTSVATTSSGNDNLNRFSGNTDESVDSAAIGAAGAVVANKDGDASRTEVDGSDNSRAIADDGSAAANGEGSEASVDNSDNSTYDKAEASFGGAAVNGSGTATVDASDNSNNSDNSDNSVAAAFKDGVAANGGDASADNSVTLGAIAVNTNVLGSTVADNETTVSGWKSDQETTNEVNGSFGGVAGISVAAQNLGQSAAVQQSVNVQANIQ